MSNSTTSRIHALMAAGAVAATLLATAACGSSSSSTPKASGSASSGAAGSGGSGAGASVKVGAFDFPEGVLLANLYADALDKQGFKASVVQLQQRETAEPALQAGDVDVIPEYVSSDLDFYQANASSSDSQANLTKLQALSKAKGVTVLTPSAATDNYAYSTSSSFAKANNITTLSELAAYSKSHPITLAGTPECKDRSYCYLGLQQTYGMKFGGYLTTVLSSQASVDLLLKNKAQLLESNSSDGVLAVNPVTVLTDDKGLNHVDAIVPAVNTKAATPALTAALDGISVKLTQNVLNAGNKAVQIDRVPPTSAAKTAAAAF